MHLSLYTYFPSRMHGCHESGSIVCSFKSTDVFHAFGKCLCEKCGDMHIELTKDFFSAKLLMSMSSSIRGHQC